MKNASVLKKHLFQWQYVTSVTLYCFSRPFLKQLPSHDFANTLHLKFFGMKIFSSILGNIFLEDFKVFCTLLMKDKSLRI